MCLAVSLVARDWSHQDFTYTPECIMGDEIFIDVKLPNLMVLEGCIFSDNVARSLRAPVKWEDFTRSHARVD